MHWGKNPLQHFPNFYIASGWKGDSNEIYSYYFHFRSTIQPHSQKSRNWLNKKNIYMHLSGTANPKSTQSRWKFVGRYYESWNGTNLPLLVRVHTEFQRQHTARWSARSIQRSKPEIAEYMQILLVFTSEICLHDAWKLKPTPVISCSKPYIWGNRFPPVLGSPQKQYSNR